MFLYGIQVDDKLIERRNVKWNQNISEILKAHNVQQATINELVKAAKGVFDVRKLVTNRSYTLICKADSMHTASAMIYEPNEIDYVVFNLEDSLWVEQKQKEVMLVEREIAGTIENSLAVAMEEMGMTPQLTNDFADIFAWQVDFFRLFPGDKFKVIFEEKIVDGESIGINQIKGAYFDHNGEAFYAVRFEQDQKEDFFDPKGNSLRKALLKYPLEFTRISSRYTGRRFHPVLKRYKAHRGTDFAAPRGTPIRSVGDGVVLEARYGKYNGNYVKIKHNGIYSTQYLHMYRIARGIRPGVKIKQGQIIGYVGRTGLARGNHLCYRFWKNGRQVDALRVNLPPSQPIKEENKLSYTAISSSVTNRLDKIPIPERKGKLLAKSR